MTPTSKLKLLASCGLAVLPLGLSAQITYTWDGDTNTDFEVATNWNLDIAPANDTTTNIAQLTGGTVNLSVDRSVNGLDLNAATTLTGTGTRLTLGAGGLSGAADLTLGGTAIIRTGLGTYTGANVTLDAGTVEFNSNDTGILGTGTITLDNGGMLAGQGNHVNMGGTTGIVVGAGGGTLRNAHTGAFYDLPVISGAGLLTLDGAASTDYAGNSRIQMGGLLNTYAGGTLITNKANVQIDADQAFGAIAGKVTIDDARLVTTNNTTFDAAREFEIGAGGARISLNQKYSTINGVLSGSAPLTFDGQSRDDDAVTVGGTIVLNGANTLTSDVLIDGVAVRYEITGQLGTGEVTLDNGGEIYGANHIDMSGNTSLVLGAGGGTIRHRHARNVNGLGSVVISGSGALTLAGESDSGSIRMDNTNNTYTGGTIFGAGGYALVKGNGSLGDAASAITFSGGIMQNSNSNLDLGTRAISIDANGGSIKSGWTNKRVSSDGVISGVGKLTILNDSSDVILTGATNTYSGGTEVQGYLRANTGSLGTGDVTLNDTGSSRGRIQNNLGASVLTNNLIIGVTTSEIVEEVEVFTTTDGRLMAGWDSPLEFSGVVSGPGNLTVVGDSGTVVLSGTTNTFDNNINLEASNSRLKVVSLGTAGTYSGDVTGAGIFDYAFATTPTALSGTYDHTGGTAISDVTVTATDIPVLNCFGSTHNIILASGGILDVEGTVLPNGFLNPEGGTLLNNGAAVDYSSNTFTSNGGSFTVDGTGDVTLGEITRSAGNPLVIKDGAGTLTMIGATDNVAGQAQVEAGTFVMAKTSSASVHAIGGLLTVNGGTAQLAGTGDDQIYNQSIVTLNGGTLDVAGKWERFKFLNLFGGTVTDSSTGGEIFVNNIAGAGYIDAQSGSIASILSGDAPLVKTTAGTVTLSGANTNSGDITVSEGTLVISQVNTNNESSIVTITAGVLQLDSGASDTVDQLWIDGVQQASGTYGSTSSAAATMDDTHFAGTGFLTVTSSPPAGFASWVTGTFANGTIPALEQGVDGDPDGDGISNLIEYAIDGEDPTVNNSNISTVTGNIHSFTKNAAATGLTYSIEESTDLGLTDPWTEVSGAGYTNDATTISYELTPGTPDDNFIRLNVTN